MQCRKFLEALEAVVYVALHSGAHAVNSKEIAQHQGVQPRYLEQIMQKLVKAGILRGSRGPKGGYTLARERRRQTVGEIFQVVAQLENQRKPNKKDSKLFKTVLTPLWDQMQDDTVKRLEDVSIEDLCKEAGVVAPAEKKTDFAI